ncbi:MAG TPA: CCA tRNA nucleotidyltransferase [Candidatus Acidoferrum sp.]|nr:CCA tRNA nucleotidyltransferase [Candidatus Acidoferrum sp.]
MTPRELANAICETLQRAGYQALLAGGCVRDLLLQREPADYDVATNATPDQVLQLFPDGLTVGAQFGVILVLQDGMKVEVATFRSDIGYADGRHPDRVVYSHTPEEDVQRRDFTINGLLMRHDTEEVFDFVSGRADLRAGIIRAIGEPDRRFAEDKLRMLRGARFAARFSYKIEPETFRAIQRHAREIQRVSAERVREELTKILTEGKARSGFEWLDGCGLLANLIPEVSAFKGVQQPPQYHPEGDVWVHTMLMLEGLPARCSATLAWGVLLHDVGKPATFRSAQETGDRIRFDGHVEVGMALARVILARLRFSNDDLEQVLRLIENHMRFKDVGRMKPATLKRFVRLPQFDEHLALHKLDCLSSHRNLEAYDFVKSFVRDTPPEVVRPSKLITGRDLLEMGHAAGPAIGKMLAAVEEAQLNGELSDRDAAIAFVQRSFGPSGDAGEA